MLLNVLLLFVFLPGFYYFDNCFAMEGTLRYLFVKIRFLWMALYFSAAVHLSTAILWKAFRPCCPEEHLEA